MRFFTFIVSFVSLAAIAAAQSPVRVAEVQQQFVGQTQAVTGTLRAVMRGNVAALEPGRLIELSVSEGDIIAKGQTIARIDDRRLQATLASLQAEQAVARANVLRYNATAKRADADLDRGKKLIRSNAISRQELDAFEAESAVARAEIQAGKRQVDSIAWQIDSVKVQLSDTIIQSPYDAAVVNRHVEPGDWVAAGEPLLTLVSTGPIEAWLEVPERLSESLVNSPTDLVLRTLFDSQPLGVLSAKRVADVDSRSRTLSYVVTVDNSGGSLAAGMSVSAWIPAGDKTQQLVVPHDAVVRRGGQPVVFQVQEGKAVQTAVSILFETATQVAVSSPSLRAGNRVIVEGNERVLNQQAVAVIKTAPAHAMLAKN